MDIEKLIEQLNDFNENHIAVLCGSGQCACGYLCDKDDCIVVRAATALSTLQIENQALRNSANGFKAENEKLRAELERMAGCVHYRPGGLCGYGGDDPANVCVLGPCPHEMPRGG